LEKAPQLLNNQRKVRKSSSINTLYTYKLFLYRTEKKCAVISDPTPIHKLYANGLNTLSILLNLITAISAGITTT
jgi:hypothetical protein